MSVTRAFPERDRRIRNITVTLSNSHHRPTKRLSKFGLMTQVEASNDPADATMIVIKLSQPGMLALIQVQGPFKFRTCGFQTEKIDRSIEGLLLFCPEFRVSTEPERCVARQYRCEVVVRATLRNGEQPLDVIVGEFERLIAHGPYFADETATMVGALTQGKQDYFVCI